MSQVLTDPNRNYVPRRRKADYIYTGKPCKYGHIGPRYKNGNCVECLLVRSRLKYDDPQVRAEKSRERMEQYHSNPEESRRKQREYRERNKERLNYKRRQKYKENPEPRRRAAQEYRRKYPERVKESNAKYYKANKEKRNRDSRAYGLKHRDRLRLYNRLYSKHHYLKNKAAYAEKRSRRRLHKKEATPTWANIDKMREIYEESVEISKRTGVKHSVDHIVPLVGRSTSSTTPIVCGLHWEGNLQIIPHEQNLKKGCYWWPDQPTDN